MEFNYSINAYKTPSIITLMTNYTRHKIEEVGDRQRVMKKGQTLI